MVIAAPPFEAGTVKAIEACAFPGVAVPICGGPGTAGAIVIEKLWFTPPAALVARMTPVNVPVAEAVPVRVPLF